MLKLLAFDLDGTLLDGRKQISEENLSALKEAAAAGITLVPATGRIYRGIPEALKALPFLRYYILSNGAALYDAETRQVIRRADVPLELALRCYDYLDTLPVIYDCYQNEMGYMNRSMMERAGEYMAREPGILELLYPLRVPVEDLKESLRQRGEDLQKLQLWFRPEELWMRQTQLEEIPRRFPELKASTSISNNIELNSIDAGKGRALEALCAHLGIETAESAAFGDGINDLELLQAAGMGIAMANADPALLKAADRVTESNEENGVARGIRRLLAGEWR